MEHTILSGKYFYTLYPSITGVLEVVNVVIKRLEDVLEEYNKSKKTLSVVYKTHTGEDNDPRTNLIIDCFNKKTGLIQFSYYDNDGQGNKKKIYSTYTNVSEIVRVIVE